MSGLTEQDLKQMDRDARQRSEKSSKNAAEEAPQNKKTSKKQNTKTDEGIRPFWEKVAAYRNRSNRARSFPLVNMSGNTMFVNSAALTEFGLTAPCYVYLYFDSEYRRLALVIVNQDTEDRPCRATRLRLGYRKQSKDMRLSIQGARSEFGIYEHGLFHITKEYENVLVVHLQEPVDG